MYRPPVYIRERIEKKQKKTDNITLDKKIIQNNPYNNTK